MKGETALAAWDHGTAGHEDRMGTATHPVTKLGHYRINDIHGEDSLQSLSLAVEMVHRRLASLVEVGEQLLDSEGGEFSLKAYFHRPTALQRTVDPLRSGAKPATTPLVEQARG